jgi:hypothetical protein
MESITRRESLNVSPFAGIAFLPFIGEGDKGAAPPTDTSVYASSETSRYHLQDSRP